MSGQPAAGSRKQQLKDGTSGGKQAGFPQELLPPRVPMRCAPLLSPWAVPLPAVSQRGPIWSSSSGVRRKSALLLTVECALVNMLLLLSRREWMWRKGNKADECSAVSLNAHTRTEVQCTHTLKRVELPASNILTPSFSRPVLLSPCPSLAPSF